MVFGSRNAIKSVTKKRYITIMNEMFGCKKTQYASRNVTKKRYIIIMMYVMKICNAHFSYFEKKKQSRSHKQIQ